MQKLIGISLAALLSGSVAVAPSLAQVDVDANLGSDGADASVDIGGGGDDGGGASVDANVGGGDGVDADANVGGGDGADANVSVGGGGGADADVNIGGADGEGGADVDIGIGGETGDGGDGEGGTSGIDVDGNGAVSASGSGAVAGTAGQDCIGENDELFSQLMAIDYSGSAVSEWSNATQAAFIPVSLCGGLDGQLGSGLLAQAAQSNPVLQAALAQSEYDATDIVAVVQSGQSLNVYVD